jgi:hypothetical protein
VPLRNFSAVSPGIQMKPQYIAIARLLALAFPLTANICLLQTRAADRYCPTNQEETYGARQLALAS